MSAVMVAFLFPALLIILAGPGFVAIIQALGDMGG
jgi:tight adherence protein C